MKLRFEPALVSGLDTAYPVRRLGRFWRNLVGAFCPPLKVPSEANTKRRIALTKKYVDELKNVVLGTSLSQWVECLKRGEVLAVAAPAGAELSGAAASSGAPSGSADSAGAAASAAVPAAAAAGLPA